MSGYAKRHHTTPTIVLRNFADAEEEFFVFDKRNHCEGVVKDSIDNRFVKKHQNRILGQDGKPDLSLETHFSRLESIAGPLMQKILSALREGRFPSLTPSEKESWNKFVLAQWARVPDFRRQICSEEDFRRMTEHLLDSYETRSPGSVDPDERDQLLGTDKQAELRDYAIKTALKKDFVEAEAVLRNRGLGFAVITNHRKSFIIGDNTVLKITPPDSSDLRHTSVEAWFPIAPNVLVTPWGSPYKEYVIQMDDRNIRRVNEALFAHSNLLASRSEALLRSLAGI